MVVVGHSRGTWDEVSLREKDLRILSLTEINSPCSSPTSTTHDLEESTENVVYSMIREIFGPGVMSEEKIIEE